MRPFKVAPYAVATALSLVVFAGCKSTEEQQLEQQIKAEEVRLEERLKAEGGKSDSVVRVVKTKSMVRAGELIDPYSLYEMPMLASEAPEDSVLSVSMVAGGCAKRDLLKDHIILRKDLSFDGAGVSSRDPKSKLGPELP